MTTGDVPEWAKKSKMDMDNALAWSRSASTQLDFVPSFFAAQGQEAGLEVWVWNQKHAVKLGINDRVAYMMTH